MAGPPPSGSHSKAGIPETSLHTEVLFESVDTKNTKQIRDLVLIDHADLAGHDWLHNGGRTPMHRAVEMGDAGIMSLLVELGGDVNVPDGLGRTPVHLACRMGSMDVLRVLLASGRANLRAGAMVCLSLPAHLWYSSCFCRYLCRGKVTRPSTSLLSTATTPSSPSSCSTGRMSI